MMHLSRLILNPRSRQVQRELADPYEMHRTICRAFPGANFTKNEPSGILFRVDLHPRTGIPTLLAQSLQRPDWSFLLADWKDYLLGEAELPLDVENPAVKPVQLKLNVGQFLAFRLRANPTIKKVRRDKDGKRRNSNRVPLVREDEQVKWLERKLDGAGSVLHSAQISNQTSVYGKLFIEKDHKEKRMKFFSVQFEGVLEVKDPASLLDTVQAGIGSGKGLGFGLLSLAPVRG
jgi:CRISPR system Cascade subunit CasE